MARPARKYIIIPEFKPLYAMNKCFGPQHGPLKQPTPTPISVIGELLRQSGSEKLTIMEVLMNPDGTTSKPVELTLENYTLPYEEIAGGKKREPGPVVTPIEVAKEAVKPVIKNKVVDLTDTAIVQDTVTLDIPPVQEEATAVSAEVETEQAVPPEPGVTVTASDGVEVEETDNKVKPYSQMSKKERREARRKAAAEAAAAAEATDITSIED